MGSTEVLKAPSLQSNHFEMQAQLVSAVRSAISTASGPLLLDAGLELAKKV